MSRTRDLEIRAVKTLENHMSSEDHNWVCLFFDKWHYAQDHGITDDEFFMWWIETDETNMLKGVLSE